MDWLWFVFLLPVAFCGGLMLAAFVAVLVGAVFLALVAVADGVRRSRRSRSSVTIRGFPEFRVNAPMPNGTKAPRGSNARH